jgi:hypothetical protein
MLAYLFWHRPYATTTVKQYEEALLRFQQHLGQQHAFDSGLAYAAAGHSVAPSSRRTAPATSANDVVAASDGARSRHGVRYHRAAGCQLAIHIETCVEARRDRIAPSGRKEGQSISKRFPSARASNRGPK